MESTQRRLLHDNVARLALASAVLHAQSGIDTPEGRTRSARRKAVVEPVNGHIKHARRFRQFSGRGPVAAKTAAPAPALGQTITTWKW